MTRVSLARVCRLSWLLLVATTAQAQAPTDPYNYARVTSHTWRADGLLETETVGPDNAASCVVTSYGYDNYGNRNAVALANCAGASGRALFAARSSSSSFAAQTVSVGGVSVAIPAGVFPVAQTNALNQTGTKTFDPRFGAVTQAADPNGLAVLTEFDDFGRPIRETQPDGTRTVTYYCYLPGRVADTGANTPGCPSPSAAEIPAEAVLFVHSEPRDNSGAVGVKNGPFTRTYSDRAGRSIRSVSEAFDGASQPGGSERLIVRDTDFNPQGKPVVTTQPFFLDSGSSTAGGSIAYGMTYTVYDALGRATTTYAADNQGSQSSVAFGTRGNRRAAWTRSTYSGLVSVTTNDLGQTRQEERDVDGKVVRITDALGAQLVHQHDAFGNLVKTRDALQNTISVGYDIRGRKLSLNDPDAGLWQYDYNAAGELVWQQNATQRAAMPTAQATTMAYDALGRLTQRVEPEYTSTWRYDAYSGGATCTQGIGKLCEVTTSHSLNRKLVYDNLGRLLNTRTSITNGPSFASALGYDAASGRLASRTYPTGLRINYSYTARGYLDTLSLAAAATVNPLPASPGGTPGAGSNLPAGAVLWQAQAYNAWGQLEQQRFGNAVIGKTGFDALSGRIGTMAAGPGTATTVLDHAYAWDSVGHLTSRIDHNGDGGGAVSETFGHDALGRLASYTVAGPGIPDLARNVTLSYNALGAILHKSDVGNYSYPGAGAVRPHAVQSVSGATTTSYGYDANGNLASANAGKYRSIAYTSFNLPNSQQGAAGAAGSPTYTWQYDEQHQRFKETRVIAAGTMAGTRSTWMLHPDNAGGLGFESEINTPTSPSAANPSATSNRHYLSAAGHSIGVLVSSGALPTLAADQTAPQELASVTLVKVEYWHKDHLGSLAATTDHAAALTQRYAYDPFGKRRYTSGSYDASGALVQDWSPAVNAGTDRGFTGHEQLDDIGLVHMNGRIYDPNMGRFVQPDPNITFPEDLRNYDRYTYVLNDPLGMTDPTGLDPCNGDRDCRERLRRNAQGWIVTYQNPDSSSGSRAPSSGGSVGQGGSTASKGGAAQSDFAAKGVASPAGAVGAPGSQPVSEADLDRTVGRGLLWAADMVDDFNRSEPGRMLQGMLPGEAAAAGGLKAGLLWLGRLAKADELAKGVTGFAPGAAETALTGMRNGGGHAIRHLEGNLIPNTGSLQSRVDAFKALATPILENPVHAANWRIGATEGRAFLGSVNGQNVVIVVAKDGPHQGKVISSFVPDSNQLSLILSR